MYKSPPYIFQSRQITGNLFCLHVQWVLEKAASNVLQKVLTVTQMFAGNLQGVLGEDCIFNPENSINNHQSFLKQL